MKPGRLLLGVVVVSAIFLIAILTGLGISVLRHLHGP